MDLMVHDEQPELCRELEKLKLEIVEQGQLHECVVRGWRPRLLECVTALQDQKVPCEEKASP